MKGSEMKTNEKKALEDTDFFSRFMFGDKINFRTNNRDSEQLKDEDDMHQTLHEEKDESIREKGRDWLFGSPIHRGPAHPGTDRGEPNLFNLGGTNQKNPSNQTIFDILQHVDYTELMVHLDNLMSSASKLKPIFNKVKPLFNTFLNDK